MPTLPPAVASFLSGHRFAVAGVSRQAQQPANAILRKLRQAGYEAVPVNPQATTLEGSVCYPDVASVPGALDGVIIATHPDVAASVVRQALARGVRQLWFHRSFGAGSVSDAALQACRDAGVQPIEGGCPMMFVPPVDVAHRCMAWWLRHQGRIPR